MTFSTNPYKGTRDFYPADLARRNYVFGTWRDVLNAHGFSEYETSLLENAELYIAKSGSELGNSQLYNFRDKGDRFIALRPEQTPSLSRIVANKYGELRFPLRWFSIPNCFRYERPQKGRLREHWQLNVDIIGLEAGDVELEIMNILADVFKAFGATKEQFKIMFNHRQVLDEWLQAEDLFESKSLIYAVLDDWFKKTDDERRTELAAELDTNQINKIFAIVSGNFANETHSPEYQSYLDIAMTKPEIKQLLTVFPLIHPDVELIFSPCIIRGIAYYTGIVFEAFDKNPDNPRALFGGGRYDDLMDLFNQKSPAIGFGMGDVTFQEFLAGWNLFPNLDNTKRVVGIIPRNSEDIAKVYSEIIPQLVEQNSVWDIDYDYDRNPNKRYKELKKRGCEDIIDLTQE